MYCFVSDRLWPIPPAPIPPKCCFCLRDEMSPSQRVGTIKNCLLPSTQNVLFIQILIVPVFSSNTVTVYTYSHYLNGLNGNQITAKWYITSMKLISSQWNPKTYGSSCHRSLATEDSCKKWHLLQFSPSRKVEIYQVVSIKFLNI